MVFKPADLVPGCAHAIVDILHRAGLPKGALNLVMGKGSVVGQAILDSADVHALTFTGSTGTGQRVAAASIVHNRKFQLEMGGKIRLLFWMMPILMWPLKRRSIRLSSRPVSVAPRLPA